MSALPQFFATRNCLGHSSGLYEWQPGLLGEHVVESVKRCARFVRLEAGISHSQALERMSEAVGFPSWHALQSAAKRAISNHTDLTDASLPERQNIASEQFHTFARALPLLLRLSKDLPPDEDARGGLEALAESLSGVFDWPIDRARSLIARLHGSDTWSALCSRDPVDSREPLYGFDPERGAFVWSVACQALVDKQDSCFQIEGDYTGELSDLDEDACFAWILETCGRRPDFLGGLLALGTGLEERGDILAAGRCYRDAIRQADGLIGRYRGKITWSSLDNRFYHRLLYALMRWSVHRRHLNQAIRLARRQLRRNPNDNLGVRYDIPVLLVADGQYDAAQRALKKWAHHEADNPHTHVTKSLCLMTPTPTPEGIREFLLALFRFPFLRNMIVDGDYPEPFGGDRSWSRGIIPNCERIYFQFDALAPTYPMVDAAYKMVLGDPEVERIEAELAVTYKRADLPRQGGRVIPHEAFLARGRQLDVWRTQVENAADSLAQRRSAQWIRGLSH